MDKTKIVIDSNCRILYASYYIKGLIDSYGKRNIFFSSKPFMSIMKKEESHSFDHYFGFIVKDKKHCEKIIIDYRDKRSFKQSAYDWCDKYAKINYLKESTPLHFQAKTISIPPSFGIKIWNMPLTLYYSISNLFKSKNRLLVTPRTFLRSYWKQYQRPTIEKFTTNKATKENYVFSASTLWNHISCISTTNRFRDLFVSVCKANNNINFEGGLVAKLYNPEFNKYHKNVVSKKYSIDTYLLKTIESIFVFNTPAVHDCHGWKLGEYTAMGKAIISTPIINELPLPLIHGKEIHIVSSLKDISDAVEFLRFNTNYRHTLESNIRKYYINFVSPRAVISYIINKVL
jgi:hypothetical protein